MRMRWLARLLLPRLRRNREVGDKDKPGYLKPNFEVMRGGEGDIYLRRWWLIRRNRFLNVYLHNMLGDDDAVPHDHPYFSLSLTLTDGLLERYVRRPDKIMRRARTLRFYQYRVNMQSYCDERRIAAGALVWRGRHFAHQLVVMQPAWTLFVTGPRVREWGFWCPRGWLHWSRYVATNQDSSVDYGGGVSPPTEGAGTSQVGRGCGEMS